MELGTLLTIALCGTTLISTLVVLAAVRSARPDVGIDALQEESLGMASPEAMPAPSMRGTMFVAGPGESHS